MMPANRIQRLGKCNEVARDEPCPLMDQLVERVLPVCSRFSPVDGAGIVGDYFTVKCDVFSVALHRQLLQICRETLQILLVRSEEHTSELQSPCNLVCRLLLEKKKARQ